VLIEAWRRHYKAVRPHSSLNYRPPALTETGSHGAIEASGATPESWIQTTGYLIRTTPRIGQTARTVMPHGATSIAALRITIFAAALELR
jgi:hypothetical protein